MRNGKDEYCREDVEKIIARQSKHQEMEAELVSVLEKYSDARNISNYSNYSNDDLIRQRY